MTEPPEGTAPGTIHMLQAYGEQPKAFKWTGSTWSSVGGHWGTKPSAMYVLGWRYRGPAVISDPRTAPLRGSP